MAKISPTKPMLIMPYGYPGSGKTHFAAQFAEFVKCANLNAEALRQEVFEKPSFNNREDEVVERLMRFQTEEFLRAGVSVIYDADLVRLGHRRQLQAIARHHHCAALVIWFQIDTEAAFLRVAKRDRRTNEDKNSRPLDRTGFDDYLKQMQNPKLEEYVVLSGKHTFNTQKSAVIKKMYEMGLISADNASSQVIKPGLVNLVPQQLRAGRVDETRRNIVIR